MRTLLNILGIFLLATIITILCALVAALLIGINYYFIAGLMALVFIALYSL
jgi:uncharacterized membrane protein